MELRKDHPEGEISVMVSVYDIWNTDYSSLGDAVLMPTSGTMRHIGGGSYDLTMTHPMDPWGKWKHLDYGAVLKIPVPEEVIENAFTGLEQWIYTANGVTSIRESASEPTTISYPEWYGSTDYTAGTSKVSYYGKNYKCVSFDGSSGQRFVPPNNSSWWTEIARTTGGAAAVATVGAGTELWWVSGENSDTWWKVSTEYGVEGWVKQSQLTFSRHLLPSETEARRITTQLFRIKKVTVEAESQQVSVEAEHVSYDHRGNLVKEAVISQAGPALAIHKVVSNLMMDLRGTVATNLDADECGTYDGTIKGKNLVYALLDPDNGLAGTFDAAVKRDNWDIYLLAKTETDHGFRLRYRKNIKGLNWTRDGSSQVTRVVPVAKDANGNELYLDNPFVDSPYIDDFPVIKIEKLTVSGQVGKDDGSGTDTTWTKAALLQEMQTKAEERFSVDKADEVANEITIDFTGLGDTDDYPELKNLQSVLMYDLVTAVYEPAGIETQMRVTEMEWDFIAERITGLVMTNVTNYGGGTVTGYTVQNNSITEEKLDTSVSGKLSSISNTVEKLNQWVQNLQNDDGSIRSSILQTASLIRTEVSAANSTIFSTIMQTATNIYTQVGNAKSDTYSYIEQTASQIRTEVSTANSTIFSSIMQTATNIYTQVGNAKSDTYSYIEQTASSIRTSVSAAKSTLFSSIMQTATNIYTQVGNAKSDTYSYIDQTASSIRTSVSAAKSTLFSTIMQTATNIYTQVGNAKSDTYSYIEQTASQIRTEVSTANSTIFSSIMQTATNIYTQVGNAKSDTYSYIEQTASSIRTSVSAAKSTLFSSIMQTATNIYTQVGNAKSDTYSYIDQTASSIRTSVSAAKSTLFSTIMQTATNIYTQVGNAKSDTYSYIEQTASSIESSVSSAKSSIWSSIVQTSTSLSLKVSADGVIAAINLSSESAIIKASKVQLSGNTTVEGMFTVNGGNLYVNGGLYINDTSKIISAKNYTVSSGGGITFNGSAPSTSGTLTYSDIAEMIIKAEVSGNVLTLTPKSGTAITFSKAVTMGDGWNGGTYTVTASMNGSQVGQKGVTVYPKLGGTAQYANFTAEAGNYVSGNWTRRGDSIRGDLVLGGSGASSYVDAQDHTSGNTIARLSVGSLYTDGYDASHSMFIADTNSSAVTDTTISPGSSISLWPGFLKSDGTTYQWGGEVIIRASAAPTPTFDVVGANYTQSPSTVGGTLHSISTGTNIKSAINSYWSSPNYYIYVRVKVNNDYHVIYWSTRGS